MTLPFERRNAVERARDFLRDLIDPKKTPRIPREIRREARYRLKHFPTELDMAQAKENFDAVFGREYGIKKDSKTRDKRD